jgi:splicing factor 3A subunit 2
MDLQNRAGVKFGGGGIATQAMINAERRERQRKLAMENSDVTKDPYFMKNHLGTYECRLCLTLHTNEGSYLAHTQGKKHQTNLARRKMKDGKDIANYPAPKPKVYPKRLIKIGRPGYRVTKQKDPETNQKSLLFEVDYPEIDQGLKPRHRIMSCYEQNREPVDDRYQYVLFAADPYEVIAFKVPSMGIDSSEGKYYCHWDEIKKIYTVLLTFKERPKTNPFPQEAQFLMNGMNMDKK